MFLASMVLALDMVHVWTFNAGSTVEGLACSGKTVAIGTSDGSGYVVSCNGTYLSQIKALASMNDVSYCCGKYAFVSSDNNIYLTTENGKLITKIPISFKYNEAVILTPKGILACSSSCAFFNMKGKLIWSFDLGKIAGEPSYYKDYAYVPDVAGKELLILNLTDGKKVGEVFFGEPVYTSDVCGNLLVVGGQKDVYLFNLTDPTDPKYLWDFNIPGFVGDVKFSPDCNYIAVINMAKNYVHIYDINGQILYSKYFDEPVTAITWGKGLVVGLQDGTVEAFNVTR
ncbi:hypothetical protein IPA_07920 [Ignicoccus pacificus DSM 13166]|uniref:Uncharacterized protein n=1 Tax=Ignicoccus pacificus DSM 13166 TaxID=940294 RepID=A0A977KBU6_9CREN|nr:hypothetical protein IPA_07920 [Ignicoccus pacificus DSM 13166]